MKKYHYVILGLLFLIACALGVMIYQRNQTSPSVATSSSHRVDPFARDYGELPSPPAANSSKEESAVFSQKIDQLAKDTDRIRIDEQCKFSPQVIRISAGSTIIAYNDAAAGHTLASSILKPTPISAKSQANISIQGTPGITYLFGCDEKPGGYVIIK